MLHSLDIFTLLAAGTVASVSTAVLLIFFQMHQKTYRGFEFWIVSSLLVSLGYATLIFRPVSHLWVNVIVSNLSFTLTAAFRAQGVLRFMSGSSLSKVFLILYPLTMLVALLVLLGTGATAAHRNLVFSLGIFPLICLISREFIRHHPEGKGSLYISAAFINAFFGVMMILRAIIWFFNQEQDFINLGLMNSIHFLMVIAYEIGLAIFFLMMNSQRMEQELQDSMEELKLTMGKVKTLSGLLPICASCKKIRDDEGYWGQVEVYIRKHTDAKFTHGICPDCARELYPDIHLDGLLEDDT